MIKLTGWRSQGFALARAAAKSMWLGSKRHWDKFLIHGGICVFPLQAARQVPVAQGLAVFRIRHVVHNLLLFVVHHLVTSISLTDGRTRRWRGSWNTGYFRRLGMRGGRGDRREQNLRVHLQFGSTLGDNLVHHCVSWNATVASVFVGRKVCERVRAVKPMRTTHAQATKKK
jgi:hypothetical protein